MSSTTTSSGLFSSTLAGGTIGLANVPAGWGTLINGSSIQSDSLRYVAQYYIAGTGQSGQNSNITLLNGTINSVITEANGYAAIAGANGTLINGTTNSGGSLEAVGQGTVLSAVITSSAALFAGAVTSGPYADRAIGAGTAINPHVGQGGVALAGGGGTSFVIKGYLADGSGGLISGGTFDPGSIYFIGKGGTAAGGTIGGLQFVLSNGSSVNQLFIGTSATQVINGGVSINATAISGAVLSVSGATGSGLTASSGGTVLVGGGTYITYLNSNYTASTGGYASGTSFYETITQGGTEIVKSDGASISATISSGGQSTVLPGGTSLYANVTGGTEIVSAGGSIYYGTAQNSGTIILSPGVIGSQLAAYNSGTIIENAGTINGLTLSNGGVASIINGAIVSNLNLQNGGSVIISAATASGATFTNGSAYFYAGAILSGGVTLQSGGVTTFSSGVTGDTAQANGGTVNVLSGASLNRLYATRSGTGLLTTSGASVNYANVGAGVTGQASGGAILINNGAYAVNASAVSGGTLIIGSGGTTGTLSISGGTATILNGAVTSPTIQVAGGLTTSGALVLGPQEQLTSVYASSGGGVTLSSGASVTAISAGAGGTVTLSSGAWVSSLILDNTTNSVTNGATVQNLSVIDGGTGLVTSQGNVSSMVITNGYGTITSGATVNTLTIMSGASGVLLSGASVGNIQVSSGGWISGAQIGTGNEITIASGGTAVNTAIMAGTDTNDSDDALSPRILSLDSTESFSFVSLLADTDSTSETSPSTQVITSGGLLSVQSGAVLYNTSMGFNARLRVLGLKYNNNNSVVYQNGTLTVTEGDQTWSMTLTGNYHGKDAADTTGGFTLTSNDNGNTIITYTQCFLTGSMIRTPQGDVAVEKLRKGDKICTYVKGQEVIKTLTSVVQKRARVNSALPEDLAGWSVIISKGAFSENVPSQDLSVTPEHCFYFQGKFIPARMLINGQTIRYDHTQEEYDYYHVETEQHSIIWANDALTESWLNTHDTAVLRPEDTDTARLVERQKITWNENAAAPLDVSQGFVKPIYDELLERARQITQPAHAHNAPEPTTTNDPAPYLRLENGEVIRPLRQQGNRYIFNIPALTSKVMVGSRFFRPSEAVGPYLDDRRQLGILVGAVSLWHGTQETIITCHITDTDIKGWDVIEQGAHRWTNAEAELPLHDARTPSDKAEVLSLEVQAGGPYLLDESL